MKLILLLFQFFCAVGLTGLILLQNSKGGLGSAFGGGEFYRSRRGAEKIVFWATIIMAGLFLLASIANLVS